MSGLVLSVCLRLAGNLVVDVFVIRLALLHAYVPVTQKCILLDRVVAGPLIWGISSMASVVVHVRVLAQEMARHIHVVCAARLNPMLVRRQMVFVNS